MHACLQGAYVTLQKLGLLMWVHDYTATGMPTCFCNVSTLRPGSKSIMARGTPTFEHIILQTSIDLDCMTYGRIKITVSHM